MLTKRYTAILVLIAMLLSCVAVYGADYGNHWAAEYIDNLYKRNIISGDANGNINPDRMITRAEFAKIINLFFEYSYNTSDNFPDVDLSKWYANDMATAKAAGYYRGNAEGKGNPESPLTRNEAAVVFQNILKISERAETGFNDTVAEWALDSALALKAKNIMVGDSNGNFNGNNRIKRAEAFKMLVTSEAPGGSKESIDKVSPMETPAPVVNAGGGGGGGGGGGMITPPSVSSFNIKNIDTDLKTISYESAGNNTSYTIKFVRLSDNTEASATTNELVFSFENLINSLMTQNKKIKEKFSVSVSGNGKTATAEFEITNPAIVEPTLTVSAAYQGEAEEISLNWTPDANAASYEITVEFEGGNFTASDTDGDGKVVLPDEYVNKITGTHKAKIKGISRDENEYLSTEEKEFNLELPLFAGNEKGFNLIRNKRHFINIKTAPQGNYKLMENITLGSYEPFNFGGSFNGNGKSVSVAINTPSNDDVGLFKRLYGAVNISGLTLKGSITGNNNVGGIAGNAAANSDEPLTSGAIISNCVNEAAITGVSCVGGFIGRVNGDSTSVYLSFSKLVNRGNINGSKNGAGGIVGLTSKNTVEYCANIADVSCPTQTGGIVGWSYNALISLSYNTGTIGQQNGTYTGGIAGQIINDAATILNCYNTGEIIGALSTTGGIAGFTTKALTISSCYYYDAKKTQRGIVGNEATGDATIVDSYMVTGLSANDTSCNIIEESALKDSSSLSGLNFETTWIMEGNTLYDYPELKLLNHIVVEKQLSAPEITDVSNKNGKIEVSFNGVDNASGYSVSISEGSTVKASAELTASDFTAFLDNSALTIGNTYTVTVKANGRTGVYLPAESSEAYTHKGENLNKVTNPEIIYNKNSDSYKLEFDASTQQQASGYKIDVYEGNGANPVYTTTIQDKATNYLDFASVSEILNDKTYTVKITVLTQTPGYENSGEEVVSLNTMFAGGEGTENKPYLIIAKRHFMNIGILNGGTAGIYFKQEENLELGNYTPFAFSGIYDGNDKKVNFTLSGGHYLSMFSRLSGTTSVKNLTIEGTVYAWTRAAGLVNEVAADSTVTISGVVSNADITSDNHSGGIVCYADFSTGTLTITDCINNGDIIMHNNNKYAGGIIAYGRAEISSCANHGKITTKNANGTTAAGAGGIMGANRTSGVKIENCYNTEEITVSGNIGGIIGAAGNGGSSPTIRNCYTVTGRPVGAVVANGAFGGVNIYYFADAETDSFDATTALTADKRTSLDNYTGFSDEVWKIDSASGYLYPQFK